MAERELPRPGEILDGKYRVDEVLGRGGMGVVVAAVHTTLGQRVAVKILSPRLAGAQHCDRFLREARASAQLRSEHAVRVTDEGTSAEGSPYLVMELLKGEDLASVLEATGPIRVPVAVDYVLQACEALGEAHALGIVHRDVKPSNLFLAALPNGRTVVKLMDFGLAKVEELEEASLTTTSEVFGSPLYMAPEQLRGSKNVDGRSDIWALGATLFELVAGCSPFAARTMPEVFAKILNDPPPSLSKLDPAIPKALDAIVRRCLEKEADRRFANVVELATALERFAPQARGAAKRVRRMTKITVPTTPERRPEMSPRTEAQAAQSAAGVSSDALLHPRRRSIGLVVGGAAVAIATVLLVMVSPWHTRATSSPAAAPALPSAEAAARMPSSDPLPLSPEPSPPTTSVASSTTARTPAAPSASPAPPTGRPRPPAPAWRAPPPVKPSPPKNCDPPYIVDANGKRFYKNECL